jgi:perosamine synthetase
MQRLIDNKFLILPTIGEHDEMSWFVFVVRLNDLFDAGDRDAILKELRIEGIGCNNYFPPIHLQPYMRQRFGFKEGDFPICEYVSARTVALPFYSNLTETQVDSVCLTLARILEKRLSFKNKRF